MRYSLHDSASVEEGWIGMREQTAVESARHQQAARAALVAKADRDELVEGVAHIVRQDGGAEPLKGLKLYRSSVPTESIHGVFTPAFCVIAQGSKEIAFVTLPRTSTASTRSSSARRRCATWRGCGLPPGSMAAWVSPREATASGSRGVPRIDARNNSAQKRRLTRKRIAATLAYRIIDNR